MGRATVVAAIVAALLIGGSDALAKGHSSSGTGSHYVRSYTTKNGSYVKGHRQTNPNSTKSDNWSTKGNVNPYTGKAGTKSQQ